MREGMIAGGFPRFQEQTLIHVRATELRRWSRFGRPAQEVQTENISFEIDKLPSMPSLTRWDVTHFECLLIFTTGVARSYRIWSMRRNLWVQLGGRPLEAVTSMLQICTVLGWVGSCSAVGSQMPLPGSCDYFRTPLIHAVLLLVRVLISRRCWYFLSLLHLCLVSSQLCGIQVLTIKFLPW